MTKKTTTDELFAAYARTAPLLDLQFYLRRAEAKLVAFELPAATVSVIAEMATLEQQLAGVDGTPSLKKRVWTLIDRYRTSFPGWAGNLGAPGYFIEPIDSDASYFAARAELVKGDKRITITEGAYGQPPRVRVDEVKTPKIEAGFTAEGPITEAQILKVHGPAMKISAKLHRERVPQRDVPLTEEELVEVIGDAQRQGEPVGADVPAQKPAVRPTPAQRVRLLEQELAEKTRQIADLMKRFEKTERAPRQTIARAPRVQPQVGADGTKECRECKTSQPLDQFTYGDGGRTIRSMCRTCHKEQQRAAAERRKLAA